MTSRTPVPGLDRVFERLGQAGHSVTPQRHQVVEGLYRARRAVTARELGTLLRHEGIGVGVMTIYRTLNLLQAIGAAYVVHDPHNEAGEARFVFCSEGHHHHLICANCWGVREIAECNLRDVQRRISSDTGYEIDGHNLDFFGICPNCRDHPGHATRH